MVALFWLITLPYTRFVGGMHTSNQLLFGFTLGVYCAVVAHWLCRDKIIRTFEALFEERRSNGDEIESEESLVESELGLRE